MPQFLILMAHSFENMLPIGGSSLIEVRAEDAASLDPYLHEQDSRIGENGDEFKLPSVIGIMPIRNAVAYPGTVTPLAVGREGSKALLADTKPNESIIGLLTQRNTETETPDFQDLYSVGTAASVLKVTKLP